MFLWMIQEHVNELDAKHPALGYIVASPRYRERSSRVLGYLDAKHPNRERSSRVLGYLDAKHPNNAEPNAEPNAEAPSMYMFLWMIQEDVNRRRDSKTHI